MKAFRALLKNRLQERGALARLARHSGLDPTLIGRWERGETRPTDTNLRKLAPAIGVPYEELLRLCEYLPATTELQGDPDETELLVLYRRLADEHRTTVKSLLYGLTAVPSFNQGPANRKRKGLTNSKNPPAPHHGTPNRHPEDPPTEGRLIEGYGVIRRMLPTSNLLFITQLVRRVLPTSSRLLIAQLDPSMG